MTKCFLRDPTVEVFRGEEKRGMGTTTWATNKTHDFLTLKIASKNSACTGFNLAFIRSQLGLVG
jgi:hypothetical protein